MNKNNYILGENKILEIKSDRLFHDMFNEHEMDTIEWAVMQILDETYEKIHGNVRVGNIRLTNISKRDKQKFVDLVVYLSDKIIVIEINNNYEGNYLRKAEEYYNGEQAGIRQGIKEGIEKGIAEGKKEIVINMYNKNMSLDIISECVNLSFDEVDRIIKSRKSNNESK